MVHYLVPQKATRWPHKEPQVPPTLGETCDIKYGHQGLNIIGRSMVECQPVASQPNCSVTAHADHIGRVQTGRKSLRPKVTSTEIILA